MIVAQKAGTSVLHLLATQDVDGAPYLDTRRTRCHLDVVKPSWQVRRLDDAQTARICPECLAGAKR